MVFCRWMNRCSRHAVAAAVLVSILAAACAAAERGRDKGKPGPDVRWDAIFPENEVLEIRLEMSRSDWDRLPMRPFEYVPARFKCGAVSIGRIGVRVKGNSSAGIPGDRKSLKLDFNLYEKKADFHGAVKLNLHNAFKDPTLMREFLAYRLFRAAGVPASRAGFARVIVRIEGEDRYLGLYTTVQQVDRLFLKQHFGDGRGNLWKGEAGSDFTWFGEDPESYGGYELETNEKRGDYSRMVGIVRAVNQTPDASFAGEMEKLLDVDRFISYLAANTLLSNLDSPTGSGHNYYLYHSPDSGRFTVIPWDLNEAFGNFKMQEGSEMLDLSLDEPYAGDKILIRKILSVQKFKEKYRQKAKELCDGPFSPASMSREIDRVVKLISNAVEEDSRKQYSTEDFRRGVEADIHPRGPFDRGGTVLGLKSFVKARTESIAGQLSGKSKGVKPRGESFRAPPPQSGPIKAAPAASPGCLFLLSEDGRLSRFSLESMSVSAEAELPRAIQSPAGKSQSGRQEEFLKRNDRDGDGRVSQSEFEGPPEAFKRLDRNRDGYVDQAELKSLDQPREGGGPFPGQEPGRSPREMALYPGETVVVVAGSSTLYFFAAADLKPLGHNRFGEPSDGAPGRRGGPGAQAAPAICGDGDLLWVLSPDRIMKVDLKKSAIESEADIPSDPESSPEENRIKRLDGDGSGKIDRFEFRGPPEMFERADRNRDGAIDAKEIRDLPPLPGEDKSGPACRILKSGADVLAVVEGFVHRFDADSLKLKSSARIESAKDGK